ncbi:hypothetical protein ASZ78_007187 [Callipepla squamata]|uniref:C2H2-type domain-containing protein n=1 Tax=Callipepla squamata TaxID=9009 RepID=A0A226N0Y9_CALSU|nr:hypothetical protein ASZ78_007187 [Callipepla squamata]
MDAEVDWDSENSTSDTGEEQSNYSRQSPKEVSHESCLQEEVGMNYSQTRSPCCNSAGLSDKQELPTEPQCEDKEIYQTYYQKQGESAAGIFVPSSAAFDLQCEDKTLERASSGHSKRSRRRARGDNENALLDGVFEDAEPASGKALPFRCKKCGASFQGVSELQQHKRTHLVENSYRCPVCAKEFFRAANLRMHKLIHNSDRPHKCPECDKGFIRTADVWRHLRNVHKIERSMVILGNGMARNPWSIVHRCDFVLSTTGVPQPMLVKEMASRATVLTHFSAGGKQCCRRNMVSQYRIPQVALWVQSHLVDAEMGAAMSLQQGFRLWVKAGSSEDPSSSRC